jgi:MbtH protein
MELEKEMEKPVIYKVVINAEEQCALWPSYLDNPVGWQDSGKIGDKEDCLAYVKQVWKDLTPLSLRQA